MRFVSWNVRSLRDGAADVAALLRSLQPDVVVLQEAPRLWLWRRRCRRLARRAGLEIVTGGRPAAGNLLLCRPGVRIEAAHDVRLPKRRGLHRRGAVVAVLALGGCRVTVVGTHLDLEAAARADSAARVRAATPAGSPLLIGADVNEEVGGAAWTSLGAGLVDLGTAPTYPAGHPTRRIDAVFVDPLLSVRRMDVEPVHGCSDHRALVVDLDLPGQVPE